MRTSIVLACLLAIFLVPVAQGADPDELLQQIRSATLEPGRAVAVSELEIDLGAGVLQLLRGHLVPAAPVDGKTVELVFTGVGRFRFLPPDRIETAQLELFTEQTRLDVEVSRVVLATGDPTLAQQLLDRPRESPDAETLAAAQSLFAEWVAGPERKGFGADAAIFKALSGDPAPRKFFTALCESEAHGRFFYALDPIEREQVTLGQFVPFDVDNRTKRIGERAIRRAKRRGRSIQTRIEDLGDWNTWVRTALRGADGSPAFGGPGFTPSHYTIETTITPADQKIESRAVVDLLALDDRRAIALELFADLEPQSVKDAAGSELAWLRSGSDLHVLLAEPATSGDTIRIEVAYGGVLLDEIEKGVFALRDTYAWYPHVASSDRATYDVTLHWPKKYEMLASGRATEDRVAAGVRTQKRILDVPAMAFSFELGAFDVIEEQIGHVQLTVGFSKTTIVGKDTGVKAEVVDALKSALEYYEKIYGPYPLDQLTVATVPRNYSQGFLSFITLSHFILGGPRGWVGHGLTSEGARQETIAHELAHQWWGNLVGWHSYRDQWLSEALADFSATTYAAQQAQREAVYLALHARRWKGSLSRATADGRTLEALGPVVLGERLFSSLSSDAYVAVVYDKGSVVFSMLAQILDRDPLVGMLGAMVKAIGNRSIDTETFLKALERMSGLDLSQFAANFIYGTGVPEVYYTYEFSEAEGGKWQIDGTARQVSAAGRRYVPSRTEQGTWDVKSRRVPTADDSGSALVVPFQIILDQETDSVRAAGRIVSTAPGLGGTLLLDKGSSSFSFTIDQRPFEFYLDQRGEVLAHFFSESRQPKRMLRFRAMELNGEEAEALLHQALAADLMPDRARVEEGLSPKRYQRRVDFENALIYLELAERYLDRDRVSEGRAAFESAQKLFTGPHKYWRGARRGVLDCRFKLREGDYKGAYQILSRDLRLHFPNSETDTTADHMRRNRWRRGRNGDGEDYAALAIAAWHTDHPLVARRAAEVAEERGADMSAFVPLFRGP